MFTLTLDLTNAEAAALYVQTQRQREDIAKLLPRPADSTTEARTVAYNVLVRVATLLNQHTQDLRTPGARKSRCKTCGEFTGHVEGCPGRDR